ncbi:MAG: hypothetical protein H0U02_00815, partial [Rubrobacter sp.]|nr:hypothetical protein [Rubrobacter sp.]
MGSQLFRLSGRFCVVHREIPFVAGQFSLKDAPSGVVCHRARGWFLIRTLVQVEDDGVVDSAGCASRIALPFGGRSSGVGEEFVVGSGEGIEPVDAAEYLRAQPSGRREGEFLREIRDQVAADGRKIVVLDDDPTGVQSVHDVPVLADWPVEELRWGLSQRSPTFFILTNSRALPEDRAAEMNREIVRALAEAAEDVGKGFVIISRSDSTLRGHYPAETDALAETLEEKIDGVILCPCFFEAGRITVNDIHWVRQGDQLIPAGLTEFASDHSFGFASSDLKEWIAEKTGGRVPAS